MGDLICFWASLLGSGTEGCIAWYGWWRWVSFCTTGFWDWDWDWEFGIMGNWHRWHRDMDRIIIQVPVVLTGIFTGVGMGRIHIRYHGSLGQETVLCRSSDGGAACSAGGTQQADRSDHFFSRSLVYVLDCLCLVFSLIFWCYNRSNPPVSSTQTRSFNRSPMNDADARGEWPTRPSRRLGICRGVAVPTSGPVCPPAFSGTHMEGILDCVPCSPEFLTLPLFSACRSLSARHVTSASHRDGGMEGWLQSTVTRGKERNCNSARRARQHTHTHTRTLSLSL